MSDLREAAKEVLRIWGTGGAEAAECETARTALRRLHEAVLKPPDIIDIEFDPRSKFALCRGIFEHGIKVDGRYILRIEHVPEGEVA